MHNNYSVVNVSPKMADDEKSKYISQISQTLIDVLWPEHLVESDIKDCINEYKISEKKISKYSKSDTLAVKNVRKYLKKEPNHYIW